MSGLSWRNKSREGYIQIEKNTYVKKDDLDYFTEVDLIKSFSEKSGHDHESIEDLYRVFMKYLNKILESQKDDEKGYYVKNFIRFMKKNLYVEDLLRGNNSLKFSKAKKQLDLYMRTGDHYILKSTTRS